MTEPATPEEVARALHDRHRGRWLITYSAFGAEFLALPLWPGTGGGMITAADPAELERQMSLVERAAADG